MTTRTFVDALGRAVQIPHAPQRLVSLVPSLTEVLFSFARGQQVVGITDYCTEPAAAVATKTKIGGTKNPDLATILALRPELVFAVAEENRRQDVEHLAAAGGCQCTSLRHALCAMVLTCCGAWRTFWIVGLR